MSKQRTFAVFLPLLLQPLFLRLNFINICPQIAPIIQGGIFTFFLPVLPPPFFAIKFRQYLSSNCAYNTGWDFCSFLAGFAPPFFLRLNFVNICPQIAPIIQGGILAVFVPVLLPLFLRLNFVNICPQIATIIQGTLLTFFPDSLVFVKFLNF